MKYNGLCWQTLRSFFYCSVLLTFVTVSKEVPPAKCLHHATIYVIFKSDRQKKKNEPRNKKICAKTSLDIVQETNGHTHFFCFFFLCCDGIELTTMGKLSMIRWRGPELLSALSTSLTLHCRDNILENRFPALRSMNHDKNPWTLPPSVGGLLRPSSLDTHSTASLSRPCLWAPVCF